MTRYAWLLGFHLLLLLLLLLLILSSSPSSSIVVVLGFLAAGCFSGRALGGAKRLQSPRPTKYLQAGAMRLYQRG